MRDGGAWLMPRCQQCGDGVPDSRAGEQAVGLARGHVIETCLDDITYIEVETDLYDWANALGLLGVRLARLVDGARDATDGVKHA